MTDIREAIGAYCWDDRAIVRRYTRTHWNAICPKRYQAPFGATLDAIDDEHRLAAACEWLAAECDSDGAANLIALGGVGTGKTFTAIAAAEAWWLVHQWCPGCVDDAMPWPRTRACPACLRWAADGEPDMSGMPQRLLDAQQARIVPGTPRVPAPILNFSNAEDLRPCPACGLLLGYQEPGDDECRGRRHLTNPADQVRITTAAQMLDDLRPDGTGHPADYIEPGLLLLDDLGGTTKGTDWAAEKLLQVVDGRWANCRPIIATSNLTAAALRRAVGERVYDRLRDTAIVVQIGGASRRRQFDQDGAA